MMMKGQGTKTRESIGKCGVISGDQWQCRVAANGCMWTDPNEWTALNPIWHTTMSVTCELTRKDLEPWEMGSVNYGSDESDPHEFSHELPITGTRRDSDLWTALATSLGASINEALLIWCGQSGGGDSLPDLGPDLACHITMKQVTPMFASTHTPRANLHPLNPYHQTWMVPEKCFGHFHYSPLHYLSHSWPYCWIGLIPYLCPC